MYKGPLFLALFLFCFPLTGDDVWIKYNGDYSALPAHLEGNFPIHTPDYEGIEQLLVLSNRFVILAIDQWDEVMREADRLSRQDPDFASTPLLREIDFHAEAKRRGPTKKNPHAIHIHEGRINQILDRYYVDARESVGERKLDSTSYYKITSPEDPDYSPPQHPTRVTRYMISTGKAPFATWRALYYSTFLHYVYLELPEPLQNGDSYTISTADGRLVTFTYDENHTISRSIKVNQVGYFADGSPKYAYLGNYLQNFGPLLFPDAKKFEVVDATSGEVVLEGPLVLHSDDPKRTNGGRLTGEKTYEMDLSGLQQEGTYFIRIPSVGRSWPFLVGNAAWQEIFYTAARGLFHQRSGQEIGPPYSAWPRIKAHDGPVYESDLIHPPLRGMEALSNPYTKKWDRFDIIGGSLDRTKVTEEAVGGWYDAADWDKNNAHYTVLFDLLALMELKGENFEDGQLNIPESGNGIPDILDEAEWGLLVWKKSMTSEGGVSGWLEASSHTGIEDDPKHPYAFSRRTRWDSLLFASAAAWYAKLVAPYDPAKADEWLELAQRAFAYGTNPDNRFVDVTIRAAKKRGEGEAYSWTWTEPEDLIIPFEMGARIHLFRATQDPRYLEGLDQQIVRSLSGGIKLPVREGEKVKWKNQSVTPGSWSWVALPYAALWLYVPGLFEDMQPHLSQRAKQLLWKSIVPPAEKMVDYASKNAYRRPQKQERDNLGWGAYWSTNEGRKLLIAYHLTGEERFREAAIWSMDRMLGANPMGMSWMTGLGYVYPIFIQHTTSENDGVLDPVPGIGIYGPTHNGWWKLRKIWVPEKEGEPHPMISSAILQGKHSPRIPPLRRWQPHQSLLVDQNEFTIQETMSSAIFVSGYLMGEGFMPSEEQLRRKPRRDDLLFGIWFLP